VTEPPTRTAASVWLVLFATLMIQALVAMALLTLPVVAPLVAQSLGVPVSWVGVYVAVVYAAAMVASLLSGAAVRRFGAIRLSQIGLGSCALGLMLSAVPWLPAVAMGGALIGLGYGPITPASSHLLVRTTPSHRMSLVFSLKQTGVPLGGALAGLIVPGLSTWLGWQAAFLLVAAVTVLCLVLVQPLCRTLDADRDPDHALSLGSGVLAPLRLVLGQRTLRVLALVSFLFSICQLSLVTYLVTWLNQDLALSLVTAGVMLGLAQAGGVVGRMTWGYVADRFLGAPRMLALLGALIVCASITIALLGPGTPVWAIMLPVIVLGASAIGWNGVYLAEVARQAPPGATGLATGGALTFTFLGVVVGPPAFGWLAGPLGSWSLAYATLAVPGVLCLAIMWARRDLFTPRG